MSTGYQVVRRSDGLFSIFFHETKSWVCDGLEEEQAKEFFRLLMEDLFNLALARAKCGEVVQGQMTYEQLDEIFRQYHDEHERFTPLKLSRSA